MITIIRNTEWTQGFDGLTYRITVMEVCPFCRVSEAHATQYQGRPDLNRCEVCCKRLGAELLENGADEIPAPVNPFRAHLAHNRDTCRKCRPAYNCDESVRLYTEMSRATARRETPYVVVTRWGRRIGMWELKTANALASVQEGEVIDQTDRYPA